MRKRLTTRFVETFPRPKVKRVEVWDEVLTGFGMRVSTEGKISWFVSVRVDGKPVRHTIGRYPAFSLVEAREAARKVQRDVQQQTYRRPKDVKPPPKAVTLGDVVPRFIELHAKPKNRTWRAQEATLKKLACLFDRPIKEIRRSDVANVLDRIMKEGAPKGVNTSLATLKTLFGWALDRGIVDIHPLAGMKRPAKLISRDRILSDTEIRAFWAATFQLGPIFGPMYRLLLITGQRRSEMAEMEWAEIDFERRLWTIPGARAKNGRPHDVPLPAMALDELRSVPRFMRSTFVFTTCGETPVSGYGRCKTALEEAVNAPTSWRIHDLRRTAASGMARLSVPPHVIEKILNHLTRQISGVAAIYNRYGYEREKRDAMEQWADFLARLAREPVPEVRTASGTAKRTEFFAQLQERAQPARLQRIR
ncbi:tyrosine-type recombinase/integrase [Alsobacter ponti]|uniref:tyrosine-type recombinase/integrase n=1 Tax=Alsobacter ponti TaxID=2962936 RepID=UPI002111F643|nr:site-specific integrase [Alsobacter ponti]